MAASYPIMLNLWDGNLGKFGLLSHLINRNGTRISLCYTVFGVKFFEKVTQSN